MDSVNIDKKEIAEDMLQIMSIAHHYRTDVGDEDSIVLLQIMKEWAYKMGLDIDEKMKRYYHHINENEARQLRESYKEKSSK
jgi:hypothetical protein